MKFNASASGGAASYNYQWYSNGNPVAGATSSNFTFNPTDIGPHNIYVIIKDASNPNAQTTSNSITITTTPPPTNLTPCIAIAVVATIAIIGLIIGLGIKQKQSGSKKQ